YITNTINNSLYSPLIVDYNDNNLMNDGNLFFQLTTHLTQSRFFNKTTLTTFYNFFSDYTSLLTNFSKSLNINIPETIFTVDNPSIILSTTFPTWNGNLINYYHGFIISDQKYLEESSEVPTTTPFSLLIPFITLLTTYLFKKKRKMK
ncbi:MAG: hypothetical protein ACFFD1_12535, partial [Candidatus Thorarchaeota archaeon]